MTITYQGKNYFKIQSGSDSVLVDPTDQRSFKGANLALNTLKPSETEPPKEDEVFWCDNAGEYEVKGTRIRGWHEGTEEIEGELRETTVYRLDFKSFRFMIFGFLSDELNPDVFEYAEDVDVAIIPAGNEGLVSPQKSAEIVRQIEPSVIIPSFYDKLNQFLKELNKKSCDREEKVVLKKKNLKAGAMKVRCLEE